MEQDGGGYLGNVPRIKKHELHHWTAKRLLTEQVLKYS